jgi:fucose 4-O-acetylase-like acetyltransferase
MEINKCTTRVGWIDFCKGIGIFLVVLGHILRDVIAVDYIYSFHMPLFFFLSGLVSNAGNMIGKLC